MSKADTLAGSNAFSQARNARSARRAAVDKALVPESAADSPNELALALISDNPDNPRDHLRNLDDTVQNVREVGILVPLIVASVDAYLRNRPERASELMPGAKYLVVDGHRRLEAARRVGIATVAVHVDDSRVSTDEALLEAAFVANYHRDDMTDLEEAHALKALVEHYGSQSKAAKRLGIPQGTISTKLSLLKLAPDLQRDLVDGTRTVEHVRNLGKLTPDEQRKKADERAAEAARRTRTLATAETADDPEDGGQDYHAVIIPPASSSEPPKDAAVAKEPKPEQASPAGAPQRVLPQQTKGATASPSQPATPQRIPDVKWGDPWAVREILMEWMDPKTRQQLLELLSDEFNETMAETGSEAS